MLQKTASQLKQIRNAELEEKEREAWQLKKEKDNYAERKGERYVT